MRPPTGQTAAVDDTALEPAETEVPAEPERGRRWWQRLPFLLVVTAVPVAFGLYFVGVVGIAILLSDRTREDDVRAGGIVLMLWWMYAFRQGDTSPYVTAALLLVVTVFFVRAARDRLTRSSRPRAALAAGTAAAAVATAVVGFVPYGYRSPELSEADALRRTVAERSAHPWTGMRADRGLVDRGRLRFVHKPVYYVALYEQNPDVERTADGQPCFRNREVWQVDALDGSVTRKTHDTAAIAGDPCVPIRLGTERDLVPVPAG